MSFIIQLGVLSLVNWFITYKTRQKRKRFKPWSDLNQDVLLLIMMKLGVVDFVAFSGVCKSWRSLALSNRHKFMVSKPPMSIWICNQQDCYLEDSDGRKFKTILPCYAGRTLLGLTCGYLIFYYEKYCGFWLVNPITKQELHFPAFPSSVRDTPGIVRAILVYSPSMSGRVLVIGQRYGKQIWFSKAGTGAWNHFITSIMYALIDLHAFNGKIYIINDVKSVFELRLNPKPNVTRLDLKNYPFLDLESFVKAGENLYMIDDVYRNKYTVMEIDTCGMQWVQTENKKRYAYFISVFKNGGYAIKPEFWHDPRQQYGPQYYFHDEIRKDGVLKMWYYPHECLSIDVLNE